MNLTRGARFVAIVAVGAAGLALAACNGDEEPAEPAADTLSGDTTQADDGDGPGEDTTTGDTGGEDVAEMPDGGDTSDGSDAEVVASEAATVTYTVQDFLGKQPIEGMVLEPEGGPGAAATTDADGKASVQVARNAPYHVVTTREGYHDNHWYGYAAADDWSQDAVAVSLAATATLGAALGIQVDDTKGIVFVNVLTRLPGGTVATLSGATVTLDAASDAALATDDSAVGLSSGNVTQPGGTSTVVFVNVPAGPVQASVTPPSGFGECAVWPGSTEPNVALGAHANAVSVITFTCQSTPVPGTFTVRDMWSNQPLDGMVLVAQADPSAVVTTDGSGSATVQVPGSSPFHVVGTLEGYPTSHWYGVTGQEAWSQTTLLLSSNATSNVIGAALGEPLDETKGYLQVGVYARLEDGTTTALPGAAVALDVTSPDPFATDDAGIWWAPSQTVTVDGPSALFFANVPAGPVNVTVTPPEGAGPCAVAPGDTAASIPVEVHAGAVSRIRYTCDAQLGSPSYTLKDLLTDQPVEGMALKPHSGSTAGVETDAQGKASLPLPAGQSYHVVGRLDGYHDHHWYGYANEDGWNQTSLLVSHSATATIAGALGMTIDSEKGMVLANVKARLADGSLAPLVGATVSLDLESEVALAPDASAGGFALSNVTQEGGADTSVVFANVALGPPANITVTPPPGFGACKTHLAPAGVNLSFGVYAGAISRVTVECEPLTAMGAVTLKDYSTEAVVEGATISGGVEPVTTDAEGKATVQVHQWAPYVLTASADGYHDYHAFGHNDDEGFSGTYHLVSEVTSATLAGALGLTLDETKGVIILTAGQVTEEDSTVQGLAGATLGLDASYDIALVTDDSSALGLVPGTTTVGESNTSVVFVNVTAGTVTPTIDPPEGYTCSVFPGEEPALAIESIGDAVSRLTFTCRTEE